ncbi:MAG: aminotransferase class I/II-fold pyridoxal phosphate-dependent enzyme [Cyanobacteria bacterium]|nr:aminotransferase class I/II-fold pyridoxal phosphate-dependent enzyme [Cyanobacteriota bacterium]
MMQNLEKDKSAASHSIRRLSWHEEKSAAEVFDNLSRYCASQAAEPESYGKGDFLQAFEAAVAALLGKESALFMPSGVMAQQIALRIWSDASHNRNIAFHPSTHVEANEHRAYSHVHGLHGVSLGEKNKPIMAADLETYSEPLSAILVELPLRNCGGVLPEWEELKQLSAVAHSRKIAVHMDGARLWESGPFYGKPYAEICDLFDSVYVSFYKGLGGIAGAMLLGPADLIEQAKIWQRRLGGNLINMHPYVVSAKIGFDTRLHKMPDYFERARSLASSLSNISGLLIQPAVPQSNMFHVYLNATADRLKTVTELIAKEDGVELCRRILPADIPQWSYCEIVVGDNALSFENEELLPLFCKLVNLIGAEI